MRCFVGIDLGSTTTKAVVLDDGGRIVGRGITNSRSNYEVACDVALTEALIDARFSLIERALGEAGLAPMPLVYADLLGNDDPRCRDAAEEIERRVLDGLR